MFYRLRAKRTFRELQRRLPRMDIESLHAEAERRIGTPIKVHGSDWLPAGYAGVLLGFEAEQLTELHHRVTCRVDAIWVSTHEYSHIFLKHHLDKKARTKIELPVQIPGAHPIAFRCADKKLSRRERAAELLTALILRATDEQSTNNLEWMFGWSK